MKNRSLVFIIICLLSLASIQPIYSATEQPTTEKQIMDYVILYDESHGQYFNRTLMATALESLSNVTVQDPDVEIRITVLFQENGTEFNSTNLQGIDLLIITNPGISDDDVIVSSERDAILDYVELGGSLFLLSNPLTQNENITGHTSTLNNLLAARNNRLTSARFSASPDQIHSQVLIDDFNSTYGNDSFITINEYNTTKNILTQQVDYFWQEVEIDNVTIYSTPIILGNERDDDDNIELAKTPFTTYSVDDEYNIFRDPGNGFLTWMLSKDFGNSKMVISGSTIMFSDYTISGNSTWIDENQNLDLWNNLMLWLLDYTPHPARDPPAIWVFENYALVVAAISIVIFGISVFIYKYRIKKRTSIKIK
ncbi:MAG: hypothetical protein ACTSQF_06055 [Candidatus Heimdallarchaeaceae archaeon]